VNSTELTNLAEWKKWGRSVALEAPLAPGIYVFRLAERKTIPRMRGASDIVYIGRSVKIRNRFKDHLRVIEVERDVAYRLQRVQQEIGRLEVSWESYDAPDKAKDAERLLLAQYETDHIEFPPLNRSESGRWRRMVEERLKLVPGQIQDLLGALARIRSGEIRI
jgi:hypothetical protein